MIKELSIIGFIPARYGSTRFPGKPLADIAGLPMIVRVYNGAAQAQTLSGLIVLTDDRRIAEAVERYGGEAMMTPESCRNGAERIASALERVPCDIAVNIQGDEPMIRGEHIDRAVEQLVKLPEIEAATLACPIVSRKEFENPSAVKVVLDSTGCALYFSRAPIPFRVDDNPIPGQPYSFGLKHIGLYAYRSDIVKMIAASEPTPLESAEKLEQLRLLEMGCRIKVEVMDSGLIGVDTPEDLAAVRRILKS